MKKTILLAFAAMLAACGNQFEVPETKAHVQPVAAPVEVKPVSNWSYSSKKDEMEGTTTKYAECYADNTIKFDFPYEEAGGSKFDLIVRQNKTLDIMLTVSSGQFMGSFSDRYAKFKFDDEKPMQITYNGTSDGSSDVIFFKSTAKLLKKIKAAKKLKIEVEFYGYGKKIIDFTLGGLKWE